jgi:hypothetical protein
MPILALDQVNDAEVQVGAQASVERDLCFAVGPPLFGSGKIQEPEAHGLAQLVGEVAGQNNPRNVRLHQTDITCWVVEGFRTQEIWQSLVQVHPTDPVD